LNSKNRKGLLTDVGTLAFFGLRHYEVSHISKVARAMVSEEPDVVVKGSDEEEKKTDDGRSNASAGEKPGKFLGLNF